MTYTPLLTERAVVLAALESVSGTAQALNPVTNSILVDAPDYTADPQKIERKFSKADMSNFPFRIGRVTGQVKFDYELRGNGLQNSGVVSNAPILAALFQACGFSLSAVNTPATQISVFPDLADIGVATWATGGVLTNTEPGMFTLVCTTAGNAAAAKFTVSCNNPDLQAAPVTSVAASAAIPLGNSGGTVTPTVTTNFAVGDIIRVSVMPVGLVLTPISTGFQTITLGVYFDGIGHLLYGAMGTFSISADAGGVGKISFTFDGIHTPPTTTALPTPVYDSILPPLFESGLVTWGDNANLVIQSISFDLASTRQVREDANAPTGYRGYQYTGRVPAGGINPEATTEANNPFWADFIASAQKYFMCRIGSTPGNSMILEGPRVQTSTLKYTDKNSNRVYDMSVSFARFNGNDEIRIFLC